MAKQVDIKKVELRVSVNCCDGCKKKVKKVLRSIEGVYKTEIDPLQPKVIVVGNVEPQTLIRKLLKSGKQAEIWNYENYSAGKEKKEVQEAVITREEDKEKSKSVYCEQAKCSEATVTATDKIKERVNGGEEGKNRSSEDHKDTNCMANTTTSPYITEREKTLPPQPQVTCIIHPSMLYDRGKVRTDTQYCYMIEPCTIALPSYPIHSYQAPPLSLTCCSQEHGNCNYGGPVSQPSVIQTPAAKVGDYFSDENTTGCHVM
ncbi:heavy metal-associated isoprenylated plant protein 35-like isoform X1 [Camellia sinensis]|uniref:heavy metal-associated isoprenylated plant protein 35-like isoform X1 n=1 Tax=Camellia sinensis TaxID=4442 RepID=UPI0010361FBD|nr:heavy metal-associated isoprenylated plant protein 35-like isoform X1 [Camellia sinensis]